MTDTAEQLSDPDFKRQQARAKANDVFTALCLIEVWKAMILAEMFHHDKQRGRNANRDCDAFHERLAELDLHKQVERVLEVRKPA